MERGSGGEVKRKTQRDARVECEQYTSFADLNMPGSKTWYAAAKNARRWRLLLQLDSDDNANMMWGDLGMLYFCLSEESLAARRFDDGVVILQCS